MLNTSKLMPMIRLLPSFMFISLMTMNSAHASSFSEIELSELSEAEIPGFTHCFNTYYNEQNITYYQSYETARCFYDASERLLQTYCRLRNDKLLNDLISGYEYTLSWLEQSRQFELADVVSIQALSDHTTIQIEHLSHHQTQRLCSQ